MKQAGSALLRQTIERLRRLGVLLASDPVLPSVSRLVAKAPPHGSWWAHPQAHEIYRVSKGLASHPEALAVRLIGGKLTFVHKRLWPALLALGTSKERWQLQGLSPLARWLLDAVVEQGLVRTDRSAQSIKGRAKILGQAARELEKRLLVYGESFHSDSGTHYKQLESWSHLSKRLRVSPRGMSREAARNEFERIAAGLNEQYGVSVRLPWKRCG